MATSYFHAVSSVKKWGGEVDDYLPIHNWMDESKKFMSTFQHRAMRHHTEGIFMAEKIFGVTIKNSMGRVIPVRWVAEQHVKEDLGWIPSPQDWLQNIKPEKWMHSNAEKLSRTCAELPDQEQKGAANDEYDPT